MITAPPVAQTETPASENIHRPPETTRRRPSALWPALAAIAGLVGASAAALALIRHQGVHINGDEPQYLVEAESIGRFFTLNINPGYNYIITHHIVYLFPEQPGPHVAATIGQAVLNHHLYLPIHSIGISALLAIPILAGPKVALLAFMLMLATLAVGLIHLVGLVAGARSPWRFALAGVFLAPTYLLATTQVYPDLMTGLIIAIVIFLVALFEIRKSCTRAQIMTGGLLLALLPWLAQKNVLVTFLLVVVLVVAHRRTSMTVRQLTWLAIPALVSLLGVVAFNKWAYGNLLGLRNPVALVGIETWTRSSALLFDRRSGILIQLPVILLGIAALWAWRRRLPLAVVATVLIAGAVIYGNGTEPGSQTGGSFSGRYQWPLVPVLLAFSALYLLELWRVRRPAVPVIAGVLVVLSAIQSVPVLLNEHLYYSQVPWDPISYQGWWGGLDPSPVLGYLPAADIYNIVQWNPGAGTGIATFLPGTIPWGNARDLWGLACVLLIAATALYCLVRLVRRPTGIRIPVVGTMAAAALLCLVLTLTSPVQLPAPVTFEGSVLASQLGTVVGADRVARGAGQDGTVVRGPYWELLPGRYEATIDYVLEDGTPGAAVGQVVGIRNPPDGAVAILQSSPLSVAATSSRLPFALTGTEQVAVRVKFAGTGTITVESISLAKLASS